MLVIERKIITVMYCKVIEILYIYILKTVFIGVLFFCGRQDYKRGLMQPLTFSKCKKDIVREDFDK